VIDYSIDGIANLGSTLQKQMAKLENLRAEVRRLKFVPVESAGYYSPISYKAFDGGMFNIYFDPLELDIVEIADSNGNTKMHFAIPLGEELEDEDFSTIESDPLMKKFLALMGKSKITEVSEVHKDSGDLMEIGELACIFDKIATASEEERTIVMKDGLLRTKKVKHELIDPVLLGLLRQRKNHVKLVGVSKTSKVVSLLSTALFLENKIPSNQIGYLEIPLELELRAYLWSGKGKIRDRTKPLAYSFGKLYLARLSRLSNLLVTIEIPRVYSEADVAEIMGYLAKDSKYSYPVLGYPQTIMRAHEAAVRIGLPASIVKDKIFDRLKELSDPEVRRFLRDGWLFKEFVNKGVLGGGE